MRGLWEARAKGWPSAIYLRSASDQVSAWQLPSSTLGSLHRRVSPGKRLEGRLLKGAGLALSGPQEHQACLVLPSFVEFGPMAGHPRGSPIPPGDQLRHCRGGKGRPSGELCRWGRRGSDPPSLQVPGLGDRGVPSAGVGGRPSVRVRGQRPQVGRT